MVPAPWGDWSSRLRDLGHDVRCVSRHGHEGGEGIEFVTGDLAKGDGSRPRRREPRSSCTAGSSKGDDDKAHLVQAATRRGAALVYISVVGADRVPMAGSIDRAMFGYFGAKFRAEQIVADSGLPWTTLRATQFHQLTLKTVTQMAKLPVIAWSRPASVSSRSTPTRWPRLVELALAHRPASHPTWAGRAYAMADLVRGYLRASGKRRPILPVRIPGKAAHAPGKANLTPDRAVGSRTWEDFLAARSRRMQPGPTRRSGTRLRARMPDQVRRSSSVVLASVVPSSRRRRRIR